MPSRTAKILVFVTAAFTCAAMNGDSLRAQQVAAPKPKSSTPAENAPRSSATRQAVPGIGQLTPVPPSALPAERIEGERATPADLGRLVEWLAYLGAALYRASPETSANRELYQQLDAARDETGTMLTRAREGSGPPAQEYTKVRSSLARLHERIASLPAGAQ
jgi:hypothetical protein